MLTRLEMMVLMAAEMPLDAIQNQIASALDILVHLTRCRDGSRKVSQITEIAGTDQGKYILNPLFVLEDDRLSETGNRLINSRKLSGGT